MGFFSRLQHARWAFAWQDMEYRHAVIQRHNIDRHTRIYLSKHVSSSFAWISWAAIRLFGGSFYGK